MSPRPSSSKTPRSKRGRSGSGLFDGYQPLEGVYDEAFDANCNPRTGVGLTLDMLDGLGKAEFKARRRLADSAMLRGGVTFTVYKEKGGIERVFPFDPIPRAIASDDWKTLKRGLEQRVLALNLFLADVYGDQRIFEDGEVPRDVVESSRGYIPNLRGVRPPKDIFVHVAGIDLIRDADGSFLVLEDNLRCPSGVSYVLENRAVMKRVLPRVFSAAHVRSVENYPTHLMDSLAQSAPEGVAEPRTVVLTPGPYNSAYFEHSFLARRMGCDLVLGSDLFVDDDRVFLKSTTGPLPVDVIYRRIDDDFVDPEAFRPDSLLGVPGLVRAYRAGNVTLANALGNGVADDKAVYPFVPDMIRFYLSEEPILGQVTTLLGARPDDCARMLEDPGSFVVKSVDASGGYGMVMGPQATKAELDELVGKIRDNPRGYIGQPLIELSTCPTWVDGKIVPRRVDLRPYVLTGSDQWVLPGGLTRVALVDGSYVVNSSQGGGSKDTWIMGEAR